MNQRKMYEGSGSWEEFNTAMQEHANENVIETHSHRMDGQWYWTIVTEEEEES